MSKAKEISALYKDIKQQMGRLVSLCHDVESRAEDAERVREKAYQRGLNDVWACMKKITHIVTDQGTMIDLFGCRTFGALLEKYTPGECIEKIRQHEQKEEIQVGDEYCYAGKYRCVITEITDNFYRILWDNGTSTVIGELTYIKPTGRHFPEIAEVLAKMKEADNVID